MFNQAPEINIDATIGQIIVASPTPTSTSTPTPSSTTQPSSTAIPTATSSSSPSPTTKPSKRYVQNALSIYGYAPKNSKVSLKGFGVSETTVADNVGYFIFTSIYSLTSKYPELCLQAIDEQNRLTQPTCIPALPVDKATPLEVGPVLLSPTVSLNTNKVTKDGYVYIEGQTSPDIDVQIYLSKNNNLKLSLVSEALAYTFPTLNTKSDGEGKFSMVLPTTEENSYKIFASSSYIDGLSAKSNTLNFSVTGTIKTLWDSLMESVRKNKILTVIMLEMFLAIILFVSALKLTTKQKKTHSERDYLEDIKLLR